MNIAPAPHNAPHTFNSVSLTARDLCLSRGETRLTQGFSLDLKGGDAVLLTGSNGAGKTTLLRALAGFVRPDTGTIKICGDALNVTATDFIAWLGHVDGLKPTETVRQTLQFWTETHGQARSEIMPALKSVDMHRFIDRPTGQLSRGQQRRIGLARVILSARPIWFLDEPAGPLDGAGRECLAAVVAAHRAKGGMVIAATHQQLNWPEAQTIELGAAS